MKKLLILLSLCIFVISCENMQKPAMDVVGDMVTPPEAPFAGVPRIAVSDAFIQDKITGPWLWMLAPTEHGKGGRDSIDIDSLAVASDGATTEMAVATNGVAEGDKVGDLAWTLGTISATNEFAHQGNVNKTVNEIGLAEGELDDHSAYALINLVSATDQSNVTMWVGSDDSIKVWLNGEVVHNNPAIRSASDFQDEFKVDLKMGDNLLLVKVSERAGIWTMFVGIEDPSTSTEEPVTDVAPPEETVEGTMPVDETLPASEIPEITFDNAHDLSPGRYRLRPTGIPIALPTPLKTDHYLFAIYWGSISSSTGVLLERDDIPPDAPKILVRISLDPDIYAYTLDEKRVIERDPDTRIYDEIVVEIVSKTGEEEKRGGVRGDRFMYKEVRYKGVAIENLTQPDRVFEEVEE